MHGKLRRLAYLLQAPLAPRDLDRLGVNAARARGIDVVVFDLCDIVMPNIGHRRDLHGPVADIDLRICRTWDEWRGQESLLRQCDLILCLLVDQNLSRAHIPVMRLVSQTGTPYLVWNGPLVPGWTKNRFIERLPRRPWQALEALLSKDYLDSLIHRLPPSLLGIRPADYIVRSDPGVRRRNRFVGPRTRIIDGHAPDYDVFRAARERAGPVKNQAIFIDQFIPHHPDFGFSGTRSLDADVYYATLDRLFSAVERRLGMSVAIAAHPRADYRDAGSPFGGRPVFRDETARLVLESRLVIMHASTAVNFAVLGRKPVMLAATRPYWEVGVERHLMKEISDRLGTPILFVDQPDALEFGDVTTVDNARYAAYEAHFIKSPATPDQPLWDIVLDRIQNRDTATAF